MRPIASRMGPCLSCPGHMRHIQELQERLGASRSVPGASRSGRDIRERPGASRSVPGASRSARDVPERPGASAQERPGTSRSVRGASMSVAKVGHMRKIAVRVGGPGPYVGQNGRFACPVQQIRRSCQWPGSWSWFLCGPEWPFCVPCHENTVSCQ